MLKSLCLSFSTLLMTRLSRVINDKVYMHGGIAKSATEDTLASLNNKVTGELKSFLDGMDALRAAGVMPLYVGYNDRLQFLNARAEEYAAANPKSRADWFEPLQKVFDAQEAFIFSDDSPNWYRGTAVCHPFSESWNTERFLKRVPDARIPNDYPAISRSVTSGRPLCLGALRGGAHNVAGNAVCDGGLMLDLSAMNSVRVDPRAKRAFAEGGATWSDYDAETQAFGLGSTGGLISSTGVGGLTLGGGIGWL